MRASRDRSTPRSPSASDAGTPACAPPPDRSGIATTMPCAKASSPPLNANCSSAGGSGLMPKPGWPSSSSSRVGTIRDGATPPSDICHLSTTNGASYPPLAQIHNRPRNRGNSNPVAVAGALWRRGVTSSDGAFVRGVVGSLSTGAGQGWQTLGRAFPALSQYGADSAWDVRDVPVGRVGQCVGLAEKPAEKPY